MAPRHLSATLGLIAAAASIGFILVRLFEAAAPSATPVTLANTGPSAVTVDELTVVGSQPPLVLKGPWRLAAMPKVQIDSAAAAAASAAVAAPASSTWAASSAPGTSGGAPPGLKAGSLTLAPGRPLELALLLQAPQALRQTCTLEPRPPGDCALKVAVSARDTGRSVTSSLTCSFECKAAAPVSPP